MKKLLFPFAGIGALLLMPQAALASEETPPAPASVGVEGPLVTGEGPQDLRSAASDGAGGAYVAYVQSRDGTNGDVFIQRVGGPAPWSAPIRISDGTLNHHSPRVHRTHDGGAVVVWLSAGSITRVHVQRFRPSGERVLAAPGAGGQVRMVDGTADSGNGVFVLERRLAPMGDDIVLTRYTEAGVVAFNTAPLGKVVEGASGAAGQPRLCRTPSGEAIVALPLTQLKVLKFSATGAPLWGTDGVSVTSVFGHKGDVSIACDAKGGVVLGWTDARRGPGLRDAFGQVLDATGRALWPANGIALAQDTGGVEVATDGAQGGYFAYTIASGRGIARQMASMRVARDGSVAYGAGATSIAEGADYNSRIPVFASDGKGGAFLSWKSEPTTASVAARPCLGMRWLGPTGTSAWGTEPVRAGRCTAYPPGHAWVVGNGTVTLLWNDARAGYSDIYGFTAPAPGALLAPVPPGPAAPPASTASTGTPTLSPKAKQALTPNARVPLPKTLTLPGKDKP